MGFALHFLGLYGLAPNSSRADMAAALTSRGPMLLPNCYQPPAHQFCRGRGNDAALDLTTLARIVPPDCYLRLTGEGTKLIRGERKNQRVIPMKP
jgi:hypothetical protein